MEYHLNPSAPVKVPPSINKKHIYMDVTHTLTSARDTGVQRVVRRLAEQAVRWPNLEFIHYVGNLDCFLILTENERDMLLFPKSHPHPSRDQNAAHRSPWNRIARRLLRPLRRLWMGRDFVSRPNLKEGVYITAEIVADAPRVRILSQVQSRFHGQQVFVVHDLIPLSHPELSLINPRDFSAYCDLLLGSNGLIADSNQTLSLLRSLFIQRNRRWPILAVRLFPATDLGIHTASIPKDIPSRTPILSCVGTIETRKNQLPLLGILRTLWDEGKEFSFVFAGRPGNCSQAFTEAVSFFQEKGYPLVWLKEATDEEINWLYQNSMATVYPSTIEGFGLPVLESLRFGTPCITSSKTSTEEIASHFGGCITVDPQETQALTRAIREILESPTLVATLKKSIRSDRFRGWDSYATDIIELLEKRLNVTEAGFVQSKSD